MPLTAKQLRFCEEYLIDLNATQAAIRAGYSAKSAGSIGDENLKKPEIETTIERLKAERRERTGINADRVLLELARLAYSDPRRLYRPDGTLRPPAEWDDDTAASISAVESEEEVTFSPDTESRTVTVTRKVKRWDKKGALELLGKHLGLFTDKDQKPVAQADRVIIEGDDG
jgi:phage terminase small subunit